ncbi:MAG: DEAD/DEAH box helicase family protein, partial [Methylococcales bacterium]
YGIPVGIIGSSEWDIDHTIVVGNIQTLTKNTGRISKEFGTVIVDECHHVTATTFTSFLDGMYARYKIGLSGTMVRKDGRHCMFKDFFGPKLYQPPQSDTMIPSVRVVKTGISLSPGDPWVEKINKLLYDPEYQMFIAKTAQFYMSKGHKVLVVADRVEFLQNVGELIGDECVCITGGTSKDDRPILRAQLESGEKSCVTGSRQIISEGWSVNILSCVILAAPIANDVLLEQVCGRVMREHEDKLDPIIVDMHFSGYADRAQNKLRLGFYMRKGWEVTNV